MNGIGTLIIGIALALIGAFINNFGIVLQKREVNIKAPPDSTEKTMMDITQFFKDPLWILGILMQTILYLPFLLLAFDYLKIVLVQPISNAGIIFLVLGLILMLNEKFRNKSEMFGIGILIFGVICVPLGALPVELGIADFLAALPSFWIIFSIIIGSSLIALIFILKFKKARLMLLGAVIGNCYAIVAISLQIMTLALGEMAHSLAVFLLIMGIVGAVVGTVFGILAAQEAFKRGQAINIVPFSQITINILPIIAGLYVFGQTITAPLFFWTGVICIILGASLLARFQ